MKKQTLLVRLLLCACWLYATSSLAQLTWDAAPGTTTSGVQNGSGIWNTVNNNWWDGITNTNWVNSTTAVAQFGTTTPAASNDINVAEDIILKELVLRAVTTGTIASGQQYNFTRVAAGNSTLDFGSNGLIQMEDRSSGGSQFAALGGNLRLKGDNLRVQKFGTGTAFQFINFSMAQNLDLTGPFTVGGSIYAGITTANTLQSVSRIVVEAGGSAAISGAGSNYTKPFHLAGFGNSLAFTGTAYGAIRFTASNLTLSGGILLTEDAGVHTNFSGANAVTGIVISEAISDGGNNHDFHRFAFSRGNGTLALSAANTYGGATVLGRAQTGGYSGGITILDFAAATAPQNDILYNNLVAPGNLDFIGGNSSTVLRLAGANGETHLQRLGNMSVNGTHNALELQTGLLGTINVTMGTISRTDPTSTLSIIGPSSGSITTTQADGFYGPWMSYTAGNYRRSWAQITGGVIGSEYAGNLTYATGDSLSSSPYSTNTNVGIQSNSTGPVTLDSAVTPLNTLSMADYTAERMIQINAGQSLRLGVQGGIQLVSGARDLTVGAVGSTGTLTAGGELTNTIGRLFLSNHSGTSLLTVNSTLTDNGTGAVTLVINGAPNSRTVLTGTNTFTGGTQVNTGILELKTNGALGTLGAVTIIDGATVGLSGGLTISRPLVAVGGFGDGNLGAVRSLSGDNLVTGLITQSAPSFLAADAGTTLTLQAANMSSNSVNGGYFLTLGGAGTVVVNGSIAIGSSGLVKMGNGLLILNGTNSTYTSTTTINAGTLRLGHANALGTTSSVIPNGGGTLDLNGFTTTRSFAFSGTGVNGGGAIINSSGTTATITGTAALTAAAKIAGAGSFTISNATGLTGNVQLTKAGSGTLTVISSTTTSTRSGGTQIDEGTVRVQSPIAIAPIGAGAYGLNGGTLSLGFDVTNTMTNVVNMMSNGTIIADRASSGAGGTVLTLSTLTIGDHTLLVKAGVNVASGTIGLTLGTTSIGGASTLPGNPTFDVQSTASAAMTLTLGALSDQAIAPRSITFQNSGSAASTVTLGAAASSLVNGTLVNIASAGGALTVNLNNATSLGSLAQLTVGAGNTLSMGAATHALGSLAGAGLVNASVASTLTVGNPLSTTAYETTFSGVLSNGAGVLTFTKAGKSTLTLAGADSNTYTGTTTSVNAGTLVLAKTGGAIAVNSNLTVGVAASSSAGAATVRLEGHEQIVGTATLTLNGGATLNLNGFNQTIDTIGTVFGATITGAGSTLALSRTSGTNTYTGVSSISSTLQLTTGAAATRTVAVTNVTDLLTITGNVTQGTTVGSIAKTGSGTLVLSGDNSYAGTTTISAGILNIRHGNALGVTAGPTTVSAGATLQIQGGITTSAEALSLNGAGFAGVSGVGIQTGALVNVSGTNNYAGLLTLTAAATVSSDSGLLTLTHAGNITGATFALTLNGAGDGQINSNLATTTGTLIKNGTGTWTLAGINANTGATTVNNGTLQLGTGTTGSWSSAPALTLAGTSRFNYQGVTTGSSQLLGALTFSAGDGIVQSTHGGVSGNTSLSFASLAARTVGATGNFVVSGGVNGATNKIVLTGQTADSFLNQGLFFDGGRYAWYDAGGFVRGLNYASDIGATSSAGSVSLASATHQQITGAVTAQSSATFTTLNLSGNSDVTLAAGQIVTVNGLLKTGNTPGGATISGGTGIQAASGAELVIRTDGANDVLTLATPILANGSNALTKSGAGTLFLSVANGYTGATTVAAGTLRLGTGGTLTTSSLTVRNGGVLDLNGQSITNALTLNGTGLLNAGALINNTTTTSQVGAITLGSSVNLGGEGNIVSTGALVGLSPIRMLKVGSGTVTFGDNAGVAVPSVRTGANQIDAGTLRISNSSSALGTSAAQLILNGGTLSLGTDLSVVAYPTSVTANSAIITDAYSVGLGVVHTLGTLVIGSQTLKISAGSHVTTATTNAGVTFGGTTLLGSPTFDVQSPTLALDGITTLTLGALNDQGQAKTLTFTNTGTSATNSVVTLGTAAGSLLDGTMVNLTQGTEAGVILNLTVASALGLFSQVNISEMSRLNIGAAQTLGSLSGTGTVSASGVFILTVGNANSSTPLNTTFSGSLINGSGTLALTKNGLGTLTLSGANNYLGATVVSAGVLKLGSATALGATSGVTISGGATVDLNGQSSARNFISISGTGHEGMGAIINGSTTTSILTGTTVLGASAKIGGSGNILINNTGGLTGNALLTKVGSGTLTVSSTAASARSGVNQIDEGTLRLESATAITTVGVGAMVLNGGTLSLGFDASGTVGGVVTMLTNSTILADRASAGPGGVVLTLGALSLGANTLTVKPGANVTSGSVGLTLGTTSFGGLALTPGNPIFDVQSTATANTTLTLGALTDQAIAPRTITFQNSGSVASSVILATLATSLVDGTVVNLANTGAGVTLNLNVAGALSTFTRVNVASGTTLSLGAAQTLVALNGAGTVTASTPSVMTIGNILGPTVSDSVFNGVLAGGSNLSVVKAGTSRLTLGGSSTFAGGLTVTGGSLEVTNNLGSATGTGPVAISIGSTLMGDGRIEAGAGHSVTIFGHLSVGSSSTTAAGLDVLTSGTGSLFFDGTGVLIFDLISGAGTGDNSGNETSADLLRVGGSLTINPGATLRILGNGLSGYAAGDQWRLVDWTTLTGNSTGTFTIQELPQLDAGLIWDLDQFYTAGTIAVSVVPEPSRAALILLAGLAFTMRRSRRLSHL